MMRCKPGMYTAYNAPHALAKLSYVLARCGVAGNSLFTLNVYLHISVMNHTACMPLQLAHDRLTAHAGILCSHNLICKHIVTLSFAHEVLGRCMLD